jgi:hypothetical protein
MVRLRASYFQLETIEVYNRKLRERPSEDKTEVFFKMLALAKCRRLAMDARAGSSNH